MLKNIRVGRDVYSRGGVLPITGLLLSIIGALSFHVIELRFLFLSISALLLIPYWGSIRLRPKQKYYFWYFIYIAICSISVLWSVDIIKTLGKLSEMIVGFLWVGVLISKGENRLKCAYNLIIIFSQYIIFMSFVLYLIGVSEFRYEYMDSVLGAAAINNPFLGKNGLGLLGGIVFLNLIARTGWRRPLGFAMLILSLTVLLLAYSRTSFVSVIIALILYNMNSFRTLLISGVALLFGLVLMETSLVTEIFLRGQGVDNILSGRPELWAIAWDEYLKSPIVGYGYGVGSAYATKSVFFLHGSAAATAHNGLLEVLLGLGIFGSVVLVPIFFLITKKIFINIMRRKNIDVYIGYTVIFSSTLMNTGIAGWFSIPMVLFFIMMGLLSLESDETEGSIK